MPPTRTRRAAHIAAALVTAGGLWAAGNALVAGQVAVAVVAAFIASLALLAWRLTR